MKQFYIVYIGCGTDLLLTDEKILLSHYSEDTESYNGFEQGIIAVAEECGAEVQELRLSESDQEKVSEMIDEWDDRVDQNFGKVAKFIHKHASKGF